MSNSITKIAASALLFCAPAVFANHVTTCQHDSSVREIHVVYEVEGQTVPCRVDYVKDSGTQSLWRAENLEGYCEEKAAAFVEKQQSWGWSCTEHASTEMTEEETSEPVAEEEEVDEMEASEG